MLPIIQEREVCNMEIEIVTLVVKGSAKLTSLPIDRIKHSIKAEVLLSVMSLISISEGCI